MRRWALFVYVDGKLSHSPFARFKSAKAALDWLKTHPTYRSHFHDVTIPQLKKGFGCFKLLAVTVTQSMTMRVGKNVIIHQEDNRLTITFRNAIRYFVLDEQGNMLGESK